MSDPCDEGGEAPCFAHLFEEEQGDEEATPEGSAGNAGGRPVVADG